MTVWLGLVVAAAAAIATAALAIHGLGPNQPRWVYGAIYAVAASAILTPALAAGSSRQSRKHAARSSRWRRQLRISFAALLHETVAESLKGVGPDASRVNFSFYLVIKRWWWPFGSPRLERVARENLGIVGETLLPAMIAHDINHPLRRCVSEGGFKSGTAGPVTVIARSVAHEGGRVFGVVSLDAPSAHAAWLTHATRVFVLHQAADSIENLDSKE